MSIDNKRKKRVLNKLIKFGFKKSKIKKLNFGKQNHLFKLTQQTLKELREPSKSLNIKGRWKMKKKELVKNIFNNAVKELNSIGRKKENSKNKKDKIKQSKEKIRISKRATEAKKGILDFLKKSGKKPKNAREEDVFIKQKKLNIGDKTLSGIINLQFIFSLSSSGVERRYKQIVVNNLNSKDLKNVIKRASDDYFKELKDLLLFGEVEASFNENKKIHYDGDKKKFFNMTLKESKIIKLPYDIKSNNAIIKYNCIVDALKGIATKAYPIKKAIKKALMVKDWTIKNFTNFCKENNIKYQLYDRSMFEVATDYDPKQKRQKLIGIVSNEHIYPITVSERALIKKNKYDKLIINDIKYIEKLNDVVKDKMFNNAVEYVKINDIKNGDKLETIITKCVIDGILYTTDKNIKKSHDMFKSLFNIDLPINTGYNSYSPLWFIADKFKLKSTFTDFLPSVKPVLFNNPTYKKNVRCIDVNKFYASILLNMEYIPIINSETLPKVIEKDHEFKFNYFYHVKKLKKNTYNIMRTGWTTGYRLKYFKNECIIDAYIEPILKENPYGEVIKRMMEEDKKLSKDIINHFIGTAQCKIDNRDKVYYQHILNNEEEASEYDYIELSNGLYATYKTYNVKKKYKSNLLPMAHFIIDMAVNKLLEKVKELSTMDKNIKIVKLNIDSISFISDKIKNSDLKTSSKLGEWDFEDFKYVKHYRGYDHKEEHIFHNIQDTLPPIINKFKENSNILIKGYAGNGKTHYILNDVIPYLTKNKKSFIIISSTHKALYEYHLKKHICRVVQFYEFDESKRYEIRNFDYIIIDEVGLMDYKHWDILYENIGYDQNIIALGDLNQLPPVMRNINPLLNINIECLFDVVIERHQNWRNNYNVIEYDQMIDNTYILKNKEISIIRDITKLNKYKKFKEFNICYYNDTADAINNKITKRWTDTFGDIKVKKGGKIICCCNSFIRMGVFNKYTFIIKDYDNEYIELEDDLGTIFKFNVDQFSKNKNGELKFKHGYAFTLYSIQGDSIEYEKLNIWDIERIKQDGKALYTAFSRIKEKLTQKPDAKKFEIYDEEEEERLEDEEWKKRAMKDINKNIKKHGLKPFTLMM